MKLVRTRSLSLSLSHLRAKREFDKGTAQAHDHGQGATPSRPWAARSIVAMRAARAWLVARESLVLVLACLAGELRPVCRTLQRIA